MTHKSTEQYDSDLKNIQGLRWLPWIGQRFPDRPTSEKLLIVGESHYLYGNSPAEVEKHRRNVPTDCGFTRQIICEYIGRDKGTGKALQRIPNLLFNSSDIKREEFWSDCTFYNIVQRMMDKKGNGLERPTKYDFLHGWRVFKDIVTKLRPSHCLFIGVSAADRFNDKSLGFLGKTLWTEKLGNTWARTGNLQIEGMTIELMFVKHLGSRVSPAAWHGYLKQQHPAFMEWMLKAYSDSYKPTP